MRNVTILLAVVAVVAMAVPAYGDATADFYFNVTNGTGAWTATASWTPAGGPPAIDKSVLIRNDGTATITAGDVAVCKSLRLGDRLNPYPYTYPGGHVIQDGGSFTTDSESWIGYQNNGSYTQSGGTASFGGTTYMGRADGPGDAGKYDLSGTGTLSGTFRIGAYGGSGAFTQKDDGSTANFSELWAHYGGAGTGTYDLYDGDLNVSARMRVGENGTFHIHGSAADRIDVVGNQHPVTGGVYYQQKDGSKLIVEIDSGFSATNERIYVENTRPNEKGVGEFAAGSLLDVRLLDAGTYTPNGGDYFLLLEAETIVNNGLALTGTEKDDWEIVWGGDDGAGGKTTMGVKYVPEPATLAILGIGGIGVLIRRKRR